MANKIKDSFDSAKDAVATAAESFDKEKFLHLFGNIRNALAKTKDAAVSKTTEALDVNKDGEVDIQDVIILAVKIPGVHVKRDSFLRKELYKK